MSMLSKLPPAVCLRGGGGWGATGLLNKGGGSRATGSLVNNKLWNFHRYRLVSIIIAKYVIHYVQSCMHALILVYLERG